MSEHAYITVGARRWCLGCNSFQRLRRGRWVDDEAQIGPSWLDYWPTRSPCLGLPTGRHWIGMRDPGLAGG